MALPNLLIVGAAKSGTTSLYHYLDQHPDIFMSKHKEPHFLINNEIGKERIPKGVTTLVEYIKLFDAGQEFLYRGEASVMYLSFPEFTIPNIKRYLGNNIKIIIMLRNPIDRAYAGYQHVRRYNIDEELSFKEALSIEDKRYSNTNITPAVRYKRIGLYYEQVKAFQSAFDDVHVIIYDDFAEDPNSSLEEVFKFLNIDNIPINTSKIHMVGGWKWRNSWSKRILISTNNVKSIIKFLLPSSRFRRFIKSILIKQNTQKVLEMDSSTKDYLAAYYTTNIKRLSSLLNKDLNYWIK